MVSREGDKIGGYEMGRLLRKDGKITAHVIAYDSPTARMGLVVPRGNISSIPKSANIVMVRYYDSKTFKPAGKKPSLIKADTARKLDLF